MALTDEASFIERHVEKIILAAALLFLVVVVVLIATPAKVELRAAPKLGEPGKSYGLGEVDERLLKNSERLAKRVREYTPKREARRDYRRDGENRFVSAADDVRDYRIWTWPRLRRELKALEPDGIALRRKDLMRFAAGEPALIAQPKINAAREVQVLLRTQEEVDAGQPLYKYNEVIAIHGAALFRRGQLQKKWLEVLAETAVTARLTVAVVEVHRRERQGGGDWSTPTLISRITSDPEPLPALPAYDGKNLHEVRLAIADLALLAVQESIIEPPYWNILGPDGNETSWQINKPRTDVSDLLEEPSVPGSGLPTSGVERRPVPRRMPRRREPARRLLRGRRGRDDRYELGGMQMPTGPGKSAAGGRTEAARNAAAARQAALAEARRAEARRAAAARRPGEMRRVAPIRRTIVRRAGPVQAGASNAVPTFQQQLDHPKGIVEVWFHDTAVRECVSYSYQVRLVLINPLFGLFGVVADKPDAAAVTLATAWSVWSEPVTVKRPTEFFVADAGGGGMVPVDVFTMKWGQRIRRSFTVRQGEPIGGKRTVKLWKLGEQELMDVDVDFATGAIAVDLAFGKKRPTPKSLIASSTTELLYLDVDGRLRTRTALEDNESARYEKLLSEVSWREEEQPERPLGPLAPRPSRTGRPPRRPERIPPRRDSRWRPPRRRPPRMDDYGPTGGG